ncbi:hypothetical protein LINGRAHAP2_LOCUS9555 [Linum grandiflorum]
MSPGKRSYYQLRLSLWLYVAMPTIITELITQLRGGQEGDQLDVQSPSIAASPAADVHYVNSLSNNSFQIHLLFLANFVDWSIKSYKSTSTTQLYGSTLSIHGSSISEASQTWFMKLEMLKRSL